MALHLCKPKTRPLSYPSLIHLFSTSQNDNNENKNNNNDDSSSSSQQSSLSSFFRDVKSSLKKPSQLQHQQNATGSPSSRADPFKSASLSFEEVRKNLAERSAVPPPPGPNPSSSFQEIFKRNEKNDSKHSGNLSFEAIRESLIKLRPSSNSGSSVNSNVTADSLSLSAFNSSLKLKPQDGSTVIGGTEELSASVFGTEMREERSGDRLAMSTGFVKMDSYGELQENSKRLAGEVVRLREMEEKKSKYPYGDLSFGDLKETFLKLKLSRDEKANKLSSQVREEIKMSESDCGSARVQGTIRRLAIQQQQNATSSSSSRADPSKSAPLSSEEIHKKFVEIRKKFEAVFFIDIKE